MSTSPREELQELAQRLGRPVEIWVCPESGDVHALVLVDAVRPPRAEGAKRRRRGGRRSSRSRR